MRFLLLPLYLVYGLIISIRNILFDWKILKSKKYDLPIICVGNISVGGTGKTPHIEYLINLLSEKNITILSRGYGRVSKDEKLVTIDSNYLDVGDEPLQIKQKFPQTNVIVSKNRRRGMEEILKKHPSTDIVLMDDGFQHRWVEKGLNIILNNYSRPIYSDYLMPIGRLRESISSIKRANIIITTKCPNINEKEKKYITKKLNLSNKQKIYFSSIKYGKCREIFSNKIFDNLNGYNILLISSIANAEDLKKFLKSNQNLVTHLSFRDHHKYSNSDIEDILIKFNSFNSDKNLILTTEKDKVKLVNFKDNFKGNKIYFIPIEINIQDSEKFNNEIIQYVTKHKRKC